MFDDELKTPFVLHLIVQKAENVSLFLSVLLQVCYEEYCLCVGCNC